MNGATHTLSLYAYMSKQRQHCLLQIYYLANSGIFFKHLVRLSFQNSKVSTTNIDPASQFRASIVLLLLIVGSRAFRYIPKAYCCTELLDNFSRVSKI
jgi:FtsH-binding integral membrane protein